MRRTFIIISIVIVSIAHLPVFADHSEKKSGDRTSLALSEKVRRLLTAEMNSLQNGMINLAIAIPSGDWTGVVETAGLISNGYIFNKNLSEKEMQEFRDSLPSGYSGLDRKYKQLAKEMADAAKTEDADAVNLSYYKISSTCIECHIKYAKSRFPGFK